MPGSVCLVSYVSDQTPSDENFLVAFFFSVQSEFHGNQSYTGDNQGEISDSLLHSVWAMRLNLRSAG